MTDIENPVPDALAGLLTRRAEMLAEKHDDMSGRQVLMQVAVISAGDETFGIPADGMQELIALPAISRLPRLPSWMAGIAQVRGELVSVVSLVGWLGVQAASEPRFLAVISEGGRKLGLTADSLLGYRDVLANEVAHDFRSAASADHARPVLLVTKDLISVLDLRQMLSNEQLIVKHTR